LLASRLSSIKLRTAASIAHFDPPTNEIRERQKLMNFSQDASAPSAAGGGNLIGESDLPLKTFPSLQLKRLLVPTDFSINSKKALIYAVRLARRNNSSLILFHVVQPPEFVRQLPQDYSYESNEETRKQFEIAMRLSAEGLERLSRDVEGGNIEIESLQRLGTPYKEIIKVAREREVDLIVIATHGHSGLNHFLFGSTAERVIRLAPCPVLVVRQEERDFIA
jgi:nucleotide-binding universal stress UspA family protein